MQLVFAGGLLAIVGILFYKLVSPADKLIVAKVALAIIVLVGVAGVIAAISNVYEVRRQNAAAQRQFDIDLKEYNSAIVEFVRDSLTIGTRPDVICKLTQSESGRACANLPDTVRTITFRICNTSKEALTVTEVRFVPMTVVRGHSTEFAVVDSSQTPNKAISLTSDLILKARACGTQSWSGRFTVKDSTFAYILDVNGTKNSLLPPIWR